MNDPGPTRGELATRLRRLTSRRMSRRVVRSAVVTLFIAILCTPLLGMNQRSGSYLLTAENRKPAPRPRLRLSVKAVTGFPRAFEAFFNDRLGFRARLVRLVNVIKVKGLGVPPDDRVLIGKDGWLFIASFPIPESDSVIRQYRGVRLFSQAELEKWKTALERRRDRLARRGIRYVLVLAPHKHSIHPEFLPDTVTRVRDLTPADQLVAFLGRRSDVPVLDLRPALRQARQQGELFRQLYWRTDTHWNGVGVYVAYREIIGRLSQWFPRLRPLPLSSFRVKTDERAGGDLARMVGLGESYREIALALVPNRPGRARKVEAGPLPVAKNMQRKWLEATEIRDAGLPRGVMLHDSFAYRLMPLLARHFRRIVYLRRPGTQDFLTGRDRTHPHFERLVERERPDIVIDQLIERNLIWAYRDYE